jgi:hypothetical protein
VGAVIGAFLGYPGDNCKFVGDTIMCDTVLYGMVAQDEAVKYGFFGAAARAVGGALIGLLVAAIWPQFAKDAGVNPP